MIEIKGFIQTSLIDWDGKITSVLFLPHCNFRCPYCQNGNLVYHPQDLPTIPLKEIKKSLSNRRDWIDGVVITGGEPTLNSELDLLLEWFKKLGLTVKLDTNGTCPEMLERLGKKKLLDYVAMDLKAPLNGRYSKVCGVSVNLKSIKKSIDFLYYGSIDYEFRTTLIPTLVGKAEILEISREIQGARKFVLQQFVPENAYSEELRRLRPFLREEAEEMVKEAKKFVRECYYRGK
ncbi:MAG: anaerobic ribonucleoside-triphosphate reductase activating protein [Candidatus Edwardsbacteria bacterium]